MSATERETLDAMRRAAIDNLMRERDKAIAERDAAREEHRAFIDSLTAALNAKGVPAMPSWQAAIDYLAEHGDEDVRTAF